MIFCNKTPEGRLQNCSATSGDIKKQFSKSSLNGVIKGCLFQVSLERIYLHNDSSQKLTDVSICEAVFPTGHASPNQQRTIHLQTNREPLWSKTNEENQKGLAEHCLWMENGPAGRLPGAAPTCSGAKAISTGPVHHLPGTCRLGNAWRRGDTREKCKAMSSQG